LADISILSYFDETAYLRVSIYNIGVLMVNIELMWGGLEMGGKTSFSESFHPFRAEPHKFYIYR
jgi:hypothetical protein